MARQDLLYERLSYEVIGAAIKMHKIIGPGLPENVYQKAFERELSLRRIPYSSQHQIDIEYKGEIIATYHLDLVVDNKIVVEHKAVDALAPVHDSQVLTYLAASKLRLGLLLNFGQTKIQTKRIVL